MDGNVNTRIDIERPIARPEFPLPVIFDPSKLSELPTKREAESGEMRPERAHFYRKRVTESGSPVYGFFITTENAKRENPGSKF